MFLETTLTPDLKQDLFFDFVFSNTFPWYWDGTVYHPENKHTALTHCTRRRAPNNAEEQGIKNSNYCDYVEGIFKQVCAQVDVYPKTIYRSSFNLTTYAPEKYSIPHVDHQFPHNNFILYLNEFTGAPTYVFDDDGKTLIYESKPEKNKAIIFPGNLHAQGFCAQYERRIILVVTFI